MKFFIDNCLSRKLANGMSAFGEDVTHLKDKFPEDTEDSVWLKYVGEKKLILITKDEKIRTNPAEIAAIRQYGVGAFFLGGKKRTRCELIRQIVRHWHRMKELDGNTRRPYAFRIPPSGAKFVKLPL